MRTDAIQIFELAAFKLNSHHLGSAKASLGSGSIRLVATPLFVVYSLHEFDVKSLHQQGYKSSTDSWNSIQRIQLASSCPSFFNLDHRRELISNNTCSCYIYKHWIQVLVCKEEAWSQDIINNLLEKEISIQKFMQHLYIQSKTHQLTSPS